MATQCSGQPLDEGGEHGPVRPVHAWSWVGAAQDCDLVPQYEELVRYRLATDAVGRRAGEVALAAWRELGCRDAGRIDLRCDRQGEVNVIEINPLPGLNPTRSDLCILCRMAGMTYQELIDRIMRSAMQRQRVTPARVPGRAIAPKT